MPSWWEASAAPRAAISCFATIGNVVCAVEGCSTMESFSRDDEDDPPGGEGVSPESIQITDDLWRELGQQIDAVLGGVTIQDLVERGEARGIRREGYNEFIYVI